jgi:hypothetical protein
MFRRLARGWALLLFGVEVILFAASLVLNVSVLMGGKTPFTNYGFSLFRAAVFAGLSVPAFLKDGLKWVNQIKTCPRWMWIATLSIAGYSLIAFCLQMMLPAGPSILDQSLAWAAFPLGLEAISCCILYSVLWSDYLTEAEFKKRAVASLGFMIVVSGIVIAVRTGVLPHSSNSTPGGT